MAHALLCIVVNGDDSAVFRFFLFPVTLTFNLKFELGRDFCTMHLTAKFHHCTFNCSEVIVRTNKLTDKQTDATEKTSTSLHYAMPAGKNLCVNSQAITYHVLPTVVPIVPVMPPRPRLVGPLAHDVVPAVDVNPMMPVVLVVVATLLAVNKQVVKATAEKLDCEAAATAEMEKKLKI